MSTVLTFSQLPALAKAEVPDHSTRFSPDLVLWQEHMPGGLHWSGLLRRGNTLRITPTVRTPTSRPAVLQPRQPQRALQHAGHAQGAAHRLPARGARLLFRHGAHPLLDPEDTCGWHDTIGGIADAARSAKYGVQPLSGASQRDVPANGRDGFLIELGKWGLGKRDLVPNVNFFSKVTVGADGELQFVPGNSRAGDYRGPARRDEHARRAQDLPASARSESAIRARRRGARLLAVRHRRPDDICRHSRPENDRGFINTERYFL